MNSRTTRMTTKNWKTKRAQPLLCLLSAALFLPGLFVSGGLLGQGENQKIAVIDVQRILEESIEGKKVIEALQQLRSEKATELQKLKDEFDDAERKYNDGRLTLASEKLAQMEKDLEDLSIRLRRGQDDAQRDLQKKQTDDFQKIEAKVMPIITAVGQDLGYTMIFNKFQSGLVYASEAVDITAMVVERFNATTGGN